jgi:hypothetical protein
VKGLLPAVLQASKDPVPNCRFNASKALQVISSQQELLEFQQNVFGDWPGTFVSQLCFCWSFYRIDAFFVIGAGARTHAGGA